MEATRRVTMADLGVPEIVNTAPAPDEALARRIAELEAQLRAKPVPALAAPIRDARVIINMVRANDKTGFKTEQLSVMPEGAGTGSESLDLGVGPRGIPDTPARRTPEVSSLQR
jgi:hypothetical protein